MCAMSSAPTGSRDDIAVCLSAYPPERKDGHQPVLPLHEGLLEPAEKEVNVKKRRRPNSRMIKERKANGISTTATLHTNS